MNKEKYEIIKFEDGDFILDVNVSQNEDTVWLTQAQIAKLYDRARNTINEDINNIFKENFKKSPEYLKPIRRLTTRAVPNHGT